MCLATKTAFISKQRNWIDESRQSKVQIRINEHLKINILAIQWITVQYAQDDWENAKRQDTSWSRVTNTLAVVRHIVCARWSSCKSECKCQLRGLALTWNIVLRLSRTVYVDVKRLRNRTWIDERNDSPLWRVAFRQAKHYNVYWVLEGCNFDLHAKRNACIPIWISSDEIWQFIG